MKHHVFKTVMLSPASDYPPGSVKRAESLALSLNYTVQNAKDVGSRALVELLETIFAEEKKPWEIWPEGQPCKSPDAYFRHAADISADQLARLVEVHQPDHPLVRELRIDQARAEPRPTMAEAGAKGGRGNKAITPRKSFSPESTAGILSRLARDHPNILEQYERSEIKTAKAAGRLAGFIKKPTPYQEFLRVWKKASEQERLAIRDFLDGVS
jgi:hypothetical protein